MVYSSNEEQFDCKSTKKFRVLEKDRIGYYQYVVYESDCFRG